MRRFLVSLLLFVLLPGRFRAQQNPFDGFDPFVEQALKHWNAPGAAVAVVRGDWVILIKGYGYRDIEKKTPITHHTLFAIASIT